MWNSKIPNPVREGNTKILGWGGGGEGGEKGVLETHIEWRRRRRLLWRLKTWNIFSSFCYFLFKPVTVCKFCFWFLIFYSLLIINVRWRIKILSSSIASYSSYGIRAGLEISTDLRLFYFRCLAGRRLSLHHCWSSFCSSTVDDRMKQVMLLFTSTKVNQTCG